MTANVEIKFSNKETIKINNIRMGIGDTELIWEESIYDIMVKRAAFHIAVKGLMQIYNMTLDQACDYLKDGEFIVLPVKASWMIS